MSARSWQVPPEIVPVDGHTAEDVRWLLVALGEFVGVAERETIEELLAFTDPQLSPDGLAQVVAETVTRLSDRIEEAR